MASSLSFAPLDSSLASWNAQTEAETLSCDRMHMMARAIHEENKQRLDKTRVANPPTAMYDARSLQGTDGPYARYCIQGRPTSGTPMAPQPVSKTQFLEHTRAKHGGCPPTPCS